MDPQHPPLLETLCSGLGWPLWSRYVTEKKHKREDFWCFGFALSSFVSFMCLHGSSDAHRQKNGWSWSSAEQGWAYRGHVPDLPAVFWQTDQSGSLHKHYRADAGRSRHGEETKCCSIMRLFFIHLFTIGRKKILVNCHSLSCSEMPFIFPFYSVNQQLLTSFKISGSKNEQN